MFFSIFEGALLGGVLDFCTLFLGAFGSMLMARAGVVNTGIIAHFILTSLIFGFLGARNFWLAAIAGWLFGVILVAAFFWASHFNRRTYVLFLYICSLVSIPLGDLILNANEGAAVLATPIVGWDLSPLLTAFLALLFCAVIAGYSWFDSDTPRSAILKHWSQCPPSVARDLELAGVFSRGRLTNAMFWATCLISICYLGAIIVGCFAKDQAYVSGKYNFWPFWMLLVGLAAKDRSRILFLLALGFVLVERLLAPLVQLPGRTDPIPVQSLFILYGALFLGISAITAERRSPSKSI